MLETGRTAQPIPPFVTYSETENPAWTRALKAVEVLSDHGRKWTGIVVDAQPGAVRDAWLNHLTNALPDNRTLRRMPVSTPTARLERSLDLEATIAAGKPMHEAGLLDHAAESVLVIPMAERMPSALVGRLAQAIDSGAAPTLILLNEASDDEEGVAHALMDRCELRVRLDTVSIHDAAFAPSCEPAKTCTANVIISEALLTTAAETLSGMGITSVRKMLAVTDVMRAIANLESQSSANAQHLVDALELVFGISLNQPEPQPEQTFDEPPPDQPDDAFDDQPNSDDSEDPIKLDLQTLQEMVIAAQEAIAPDEALLLTDSSSRASRQSALGKAGASRKNAKRGRPVGFAQKPAFDGQRPDAVTTLRTAAPWQLVRARARGTQAWEPGDPIRISKSDLRYKRLEHPTETTVIFAIDASGSTALERLGEAKGCIEILLGRCYVRRDQVAMIAFRGERADILLEPTRSLVRLKKSLKSLAGGGPTPLADAISQAHTLAHRARSRGQQPLLVFLTDGRGNIALNGEADKQAAKDDASRAAKRCAADGFQCLIIDIARRPRPAASELAHAMAADYCTLPRADAQTMSEVVGRYMDQGD
ncbi:MAG: VWA domain-containing protein [Pseudomonadota bacterium]